MGDRANILVVDRPQASKYDTEVDGIYIYTHWKGYEWPERLRLGLSSAAARKRWTDDSYLIRILVSHLFEDLDTSDDTGGGIGTLITETDNETIVVDIPAQKIAFVAKYGDPSDRNNWTGHMSFDDFCDQVEAKYPSDI